MVSAVRPDRSSPRATFLLAVMAAIVGGALSVWFFGEENYMAQLLAGFGAALAAFTVALEWEREKEKNQREAEREKEESHREAEREKEKNQREAESKLRLKSVLTELNVNDKGLTLLAKELARLKESSRKEWEPVLPLLSDAVWTASAPRLVQIIEPNLFSALAIFYNNVDELRFRVRQRTQARTNELDDGIEDLLKSATDTLEGLSTWVYEETRAPTAEEDWYTEELREDMEVDTTSLRVAAAGRRARLFAARRARLAAGCSGDDETG
jgi:hypothetical protein